MTDKIKKIIDEIKSLTGTELISLYEAFLEEFKIDPSALSMSSGGSNSNSNNEEAAGESSKFKVVIISVSPEKKTALIKELRDILGVGLAESKAFVDSLVNDGKEIVVKDGLLDHEAKELSKKIIEVSGATVECQSA